MASLIQQNSNIVFECMAGFKHSFPIIERFEGLVVVVARNPYDWVRSLHGNPWGARHMDGLSMDEFLRTPWRVYYDWYATDRHDLVGTEMLSERCPMTGEPFANVLRLRAAKYRTWIEFGNRSRHCVVIRYEDADRCPMQVLKRFAMLPKELGINVLAEPQLDVPHYKGIGSYGPYTRKQYQPLTNAQVALIDGELDFEIEHAIGYELRRFDKTTQAVASAL